MGDKVPSSSHEQPAGRQIAMNPAAKPLRAKVRAHVHVYLWLALLIVSVSPFVVAVVTMERSSDLLRAFVKALVAAAIIQLAFWFTRRQCSGPDLSWWNGLLFITGFMTIGIGWVSILVAVPMGICAILASFIIALMGIANGDATFAPRQYRRLVVLASRNRMYQ